MGCPADANVYFGVETEICEEHFYNKTEKYKPKNPARVDFYWANNQFNDDDDKNIIGINLTSCCNCTARTPLNKLPDEKKQQQVTDFLKAIGIKKKPKFYLTCSLEG